ncbi:hypothetical protein I3W98_18725, partial [Streptomyces cavourensis]|nr:hypothetical protein [Streptomyces cavourensis]
MTRRSLVAGAAGLVAAMTTGGDAAAMTTAPSVRGGGGGEDRFARGELRGVWIATVANLDWGSSSPTASSTTPWGTAPR